MKEILPAGKLDEWRGWAEEHSVEVRAVGIDEIVFDERTVLKCRYHCPAWGRRWTCGPDTWGPTELIPLLGRYQSVLILSGYDLEAVTSQALAIERSASTSGFPFALAVAVTMCSTCGECTYPGGACRKGTDLRPESAMAGIHTLETLSRLGVQTTPGPGGAWLRTSFVFLG